MAEDKLSKEEELRVTNAELYSQQQIIKKRNLLLEQLHAKDAKLIQELLSQVKQLKGVSHESKQQLHDLNNSSEAAILDKDNRIKALEQIRSDLELEKDKEIRV